MPHANTALPGRLACCQTPVRRDPTARPRNAKRQGLGQQLPPRGSLPPGKAHRPEPGCPGHPRTDLPFQAHEAWLRQAWREKERLEGSRGPMGTQALGDLTRPLPGQRQEGEYADNRRPWARGPRPMQGHGPAPRDSRAGLGTGRKDALITPGEVAWEPAGGTSTGPSSNPPKTRHKGPCQRRAQGPSVQSPILLLVTDTVVD